LITGAHTSEITVYNFNSSIRPYRLLGHTKTVTAVDVNPITGNIISSSLDNSVRLWQNSADGHCSSINAHKMPVNDISFSSDGVHFLTASSDQTLKV